MKKVYLALLATTVFVACSKSDDNGEVRKVFQLNTLRKSFQQVLTFE